MSDDFMNFNARQAQQSESTNPTAFNYDIIFKMSKDMKFIAYFTMIVSGLACITIIGAIWGVPLFISGLRLRDASDKFNDYCRTNDIQTIFQGFEKQRTYFFIQKVFTIIGIIFTLLYIGVILVLVLSGNWNKFAV